MIDNPLQFHDRRQAPITVTRKAAGNGGADPALARGAVVQRPRNDVNAVPSGAAPLLDHVYKLFTSLMSPLLVPFTVPVVCSHISPVFRSLTVLSPLST